MLVHVSTTLTGEAAAIGAVRYQLGDRAVIYLAEDATVEQHAEWLTELCDPEDRLEFTDPAPAPTQKTAPVGQVRVAG